MDIKPRPNHALYIESLRRMSPAQRLAKTFELTEFSRELLHNGFRKHHPGFTEEDLRAVLAQRLTRRHMRQSLKERIISSRAFSKSLQKNQTSPPPSA